MNRKIIWHPQAKEDLRQILVYCRDKFGVATAYKVRERVLNNVLSLSRNPNLGFVEEELSGISSLEYRSLIVKQTKVIYTVHESYIYIHLLWNTMKDPATLAMSAGARRKD